MKYRSNFSVHHCTILDFAYSGVVFEGENSWNSEPTAFSTGNSIHNNTIDNCHGGAGGGNIRFTGQSNFTMYGNTVDGTARSMQNSITMSNNKSTTIYDNTFYTLDNRGSSFNFSFEIWDTWGGLEMYDNTFIGGGTIDLGGHYIYKGAYSFGASVHDNTFTLSSRQPYNPSEVIAITVESWARLEDIHIYKNRVTNFGSGIQVTFGMNTGGVAQNFYIYDNIFEGIGYSDTGGGSYAIGFCDQNIEVDSFTNINICNNVMVGGGSYPFKGIRYDVMGTNTNINIKNNVISGFGTAALAFALADYGGSFTNLAVTNNIFYNDGASITWTGMSATGTLTPNYTSNPSFVSGTNFHLSSTSSPAYHTGAYISWLTTDYDGNAYNNPPSIGAFEYGSSGTIPVTTVTVTGAGGAITISTDNGTLQMSAHIDPHDATDQTVNWSVTNGTGSASINSTGLLTAITDGTVMVKATSNG
jgi:hypothetical protein